MAQEVSFGDANVGDEIKKKTSGIYKNKDKTKFLLTKKKFQKGFTCGMEIIAYSKDNKFNRLIAKTCTKNGRMGIEFYFENDKLIHSYQTFEFYNEKAGKGSWKNFKGLMAWESRYYFKQGELAFHRHKGRSDISADSKGEKIKNLALKVFDFVRKS